MDNKYLSAFLTLGILILAGVDGLLIFQKAQIKSDYEAVTRQFLTKHTEVDFPIAKVYKFRQENPLPPEESREFYRLLNRYTAAHLSQLIPTDDPEQIAAQKAATLAFQPWLKEMLHQK